MCEHCSCKFCLVLCYFLSFVFIFFLIGPNQGPWSWPKKSPFSAQFFQAKSAPRIVQLGLSSPMHHARPWPSSYAVFALVSTLSVAINLEGHRACQSHDSFFKIKPFWTLKKWYFIWDEGLIAVNKPQGIYCDSVLASVPRILSDSSESDRLSEGLSTFS